MFPTFPPPPPPPPPMEPAYAKGAYIKGEGADAGLLQAEVVAEPCVVVAEPVLAQPVAKAVLNPTHAAAAVLNPTHAATLGAPPRNDGSSWNTYRNNIGNREITTISVPVPTGCGPGSVLEVQQAGGGTVRVTVPRGAGPGSVLQVQVATSRYATQHAPLRATRAPTFTVPSREQQAQYEQQEGHYVPVRFCGFCSWVICCCIPVIGICVGCCPVDTKEVYVRGGRTVIGRAQPRPISPPPRH